MLTNIVVPDSTAIAVAAVFISLASTDGVSAQTLTDVIAAGQPLVSVRVRYESVDQSNRSESAQALTVRARLGYQTGVFHGFSALAEFDLIDHLGAHTYCDTERDCVPAVYPVIADPDMAALNRLQLNYAIPLSGSEMPDTTISFGRQRIVHGNQRFIGNVGWRQHEQTFDALSIVSTALADTTISYTYVFQVNRIFGPDSVAQSALFDSNSHLFNVVYSGFQPHLRLESFAYLLDLEQGATPTSPNNSLSSATYGLRGNGSFQLAEGFNLIYAGTYAHQTDFAQNPASLSLDYWQLEGGISYDGFSAGIGYEILGSNGARGFATPLATLHAFQGWADVFPATPNQGIEDVFVKAGYRFSAKPVFSNVTLAIVYHDYSAENVSADYGDEWDFLIEANFLEKVTSGIKFASYRTSGASPAPFDRKIFWLYLQYVY